MVSLSNMKQLILSEATIEWTKEIHRFPPNIKEHVRQKFSGIERSKLEKFLDNPEYFLDKEMSLDSKDKIMSEIEKCLEEYDQAADEAILASNDIVKAYNDHIQGHFDSCAKLLEKAGYHSEPSRDQRPIKVGCYYDGSTSAKTYLSINLMSDFTTLVETFHYSEQEARQFIIGQNYQVTNNPEEIKAIVKARLDFNKATIKLLQDMVKHNAATFGLCDEVAQMYIEDLDSKDQATRQGAIVGVKQEILAELESNQQKYKVPGTKMSWDLRKLGAGVFLCTDEATAQEGKMGNIQHRLQQLMDWDCVVMAHGYKAPGLDLKYIPIQHVKTPGGKICDTAVDLVRTLYHEGFRKIWLLNCNPHSYDPTDDWKGLSGLHVRMGKHSVYSETVTKDLDMYLTDNFELNEAINMLYDVDYNVIKLCEDVGIDYYDDDALRIFYETADSELNSFDFISEGSGTGAWAKLKEIIKRVIGSIVWLFKKMVGMVVAFVKHIVKRIKGRIGGNKSRKMSKPVVFNQIIVENAKVVQQSVKSYDEVESFCVKNANNLTKALKKAEAEQTANMKRYDDLVNKNTRASNESVDTFASIYAELEGSDE